MKYSAEAALLSLVLIGSLPARFWSADSVMVQKSGYMRGVGSIRETLEFSGHKSTLYREPIYIPEGFGKLLTITPGGEGVVFWFQNEEGHIRNVSFPVSSPLLIQRKGTVVIQDTLGG